MVMQANPYTGTDRPPTPEEQAALNRIAQLRAAGFGDEEIFGGGLAQTQQIGSGYGYLPFVADMAGTQASYNLGRGGLALDAAQMGYAQQQNPFNIISALQFQRDTGASGVLSDPTLASVPPSPMSKYLNFVDGLLADSGGGSTATSGTSSTAPSGDLAAVQRVRDEVGDTQAMEGFQRLAALPPPPGTPQVTAQTAPQTAFDPLATQRAASTLLGSSGLPGASIGEQQLLGGSVPGNSSFTERERGLMSPDQQGALYGLQASTGRTSDPMAAYRAYQQAYGHRGLTAGRTIR